MTHCQLLHLVTWGRPTVGRREPNINEVIRDVNEGLPMINKHAGTQTLSTKGDVVIKFFTIFYPIYVKYRFKQII